MPELMMTLQTLADVSRPPEFKMTDYKPEVECFSGTVGDIVEIPTANPTISTMSVSVVTLTNLSDIARRQTTRHFNMADSKPEVE